MTTVDDNTTADASGSGSSGSSEDVKHITEDEQSTEPQPVYKARFVTSLQSDRRDIDSSFSRRRGFRNAIKRNIKKEREAAALAETDTVVAHGV